MSRGHDKPANDRPSLEGSVSGVNCVPLQFVDVAVAKSFAIPGAAACPALFTGPFAIFVGVSAAGTCFCGLPITGTALCHF